MGISTKDEIQTIYELFRDNGLPATITGGGCFEETKPIKCYTMKQETILRVAHKTLGISKDRTIHIMKHDLSCECKHSSTLHDTVWACPIREDNWPVKGDD